MAELAEGDMAPDVSLPRGGGGTFHLADLRGRPVVLYFYPKDDTTACTAEAIDFSALKAEFEAAGATVIGVSPDNPNKHAKFATKHALSIDLVSDEELTAANAYGVWVEKSLYGRKYMGVERTTYLIGADGRISRAWRKVRVRGHAAEVLQAVRDLRAPS
jgi:peroxiredoxin Q/BCP